MIIRFRHLFCLAVIPLLLASACPVVAAVAGTVFYTVTSSASSGPGSLNDTITQANYKGGDLNVINFNIPSNGGVVEIVLSQTLYIARLMVLNGFTQPGYRGSPVIRINANGNPSGIALVGDVAGVPPFSDGRTATSSGSTVQGFQIVNYSQNAVTIFNESQGNYIQNNWLGFYRTASGTYFRNVVTHPASRGVALVSSYNHIRNNTISGVDNGITVGENPFGTVTGVSCKTNSIRDNFIGTDPTGTFKIGNDSDGIFLGAGARQNFIGPGNVLSGMASSGCELLHSTAVGNVIFGNIIGLNAAGNAAIGNQVGVYDANGAHFNDIGSSNPQYGNVISGNALGGVAIGASNDPSGTWVENNLIGTDKSGTKAVGAQTTGVTVQDGSQHIVVRFNVLVGHTNHGAVFRNATGNGFFGNWVGRTQGGALIPNAGFGVLLWDASHNYIGIGSQPPNPPYFVANLFGANTLGAIGFNGTCVGNVIDSP
jgi:hypothetical protein